MSGALNVFISYSREDGREYAESLYEELTARGIAAWRDERDIDPYQDFSGEIEKAIEKATHVLVCLTPSIARRKDSFVRREIIYAQNWEKPITPLLFPGIEKRDVPTLINHLIWIPMTQVDKDIPLLLQRLHAAKGGTGARINHDKYEAYLQMLHRQIAAFLDTTVFSLVNLNAVAQPDAVKRTQGPKTQALPMGFTGLIINKRTHSFTESKQLFNTFNQAFDYYGGQVLLLGEPGAGKTTTLMAFAREAVVQRLEDSSRPVPILAPISTWPSNRIPDATLLNKEYFKHWIEETAPSILEWLATINDYLDIETITSLIREGEALLLLDGLDELGEQRVCHPKVKTVERNAKTGKNEIKGRDFEGFFDPRSRFITELNRYLGSNHWVITCRVKEYESIGKKLPLNGAIELQPLDDKQMADYLADQPLLWSALQKDMTLRDMARTPLLLSLLAIGYQNTDGEVADLADLSSSPSKLREKIFDTYVRKRYEFEQNHSGLLPYTLNQLYKSLEWVAFFEGPTANDEIEPSAFSKYQELPIKPSMIELAQRLHLIRRTESGNYRFLHLLLRDYFADRLLNQIKQLDADVWKRMHLLYSERLIRSIHYNLRTYRLPNNYSPEDIEQETWLAAIKYINKFGFVKGGLLFFWLRRISFNQIRKAVKSQNRYTISFDILEDLLADDDKQLNDWNKLITQTDIEQNFMLNDDVQSILQALNELKPRDRDILFRRILFGETRAQLAVQYGIRPNTVSKIIGRAKTQVRKTFEQQDTSDLQE
jgi:RNA polymerase sigma factor (sigma-70 family)